jgi:putative membrane protein
MNIDTGMHLTMDTLVRPLVASVIFGLVGLILIMVGFRLFDWMTPRVDVQKELSERSNMAVSVVVAAMILGVSYVVAHAIS